MGHEASDARPIATIKLDIFGQLDVFLDRPGTLDAFSSSRSQSGHRFFDSGFVGNAQMGESVLVLQNQLGLIDFSHGVSHALMSIMC